LNQYANSSSVSTLRSLSPWQASWQTLKSHWRPIIKLGSFGILLPILVLDLSQSLHSSEHVAKLKDLVAVRSPQPVDRYIEAALGYLGQYLVSWAICGALVAITFFGLLYQARSLHTENLAPTFMSCLKDGLGQFFKRGILALILSVVSILLIANLVMSILGPSGVSEVILLIFVALHLIIPVLLVQTHANPLRIVLSAITLGYVPRLRGVKWSVFFQVITWEFLVILSLTLISMVRNSILNLDLWIPIPRELWLGSFSELPFGMVYVITTIATALIFTLLLCGLAMLMTVYYSNLVQIYNQIQKVAVDETSQSL